MAGAPGTSPHEASMFGVKELSAAEMTGAVKSARSMFVEQVKVSPSDSTVKDN
jgi:hypothetical protein